MVDQIKLQLDVQANIKNAVSQLDDLNTTVKKLAVSTNTLGSAFASIGKILLPIVAAFSFDKIIEQGEKLNDTFQKISQVSKQTGNDFNKIKEVAFSFSKDGLVPLEDSVTALRNLLRSGLNIDQSRKALEAFRETAALGARDGVDLGSAIAKASEAFYKGETRFLKSIGIFVDNASASKKYAQSLGITENALTETQKRQALLNAILEQAKKSTGDYATVQEDFGTKLKGVKHELALMVGELGLFITNADNSRKALDNVSSFIQTLRLGLNTIIESLKEASDAFSKLYDEAQRIKKQQEGKSFFEKQIEGLNQIKDDYLEAFGVIKDNPIDPSIDLSKLRSNSEQIIREINLVNTKVKTIPKDILSSYDASISKQKANIERELEGIRGNISKFSEDRPEISEAFIAEFRKIEAELKNIGETELAQVRNNADERNSVILDSFKKELIDADKKNKLIAKSNQKLAFDTIKANDEIEKRRQDAINRAIAEGEKNPIKVIYEAIPAKVTDLFKDIGLSIANAIPKSVPDFFSAAFNKVKGFFAGVGDLLSSLVPQGVKDFFKSASKKGLTPKQQQEEDLAAAKIGAAGKALVGAIGQGAAGAKKIIAAGLETALGPALGPIAGELFNVLSSGPEAVKKMVDEFTGAIPALVENFIAAIPVFIERLVVGLINAVIRIADRLPEIIIQFVQGLVHAAPKVIEALVLGAPRFIISIIKGIPRLIGALVELMPSVAVSFSTALIAEAPSIGVAVANAIINEIKGKLKGLFGGGGGGIFEEIGGFVSDAGDFFGLARGGELKGGTPFKDSVPVMAQGGELFVDRSTTDQLKNFLDANQQEKTMTDNIMFARLIEAMSKPQVVETELKFNSDTFANIILKLNRQNARLA